MKLKTVIGIGIVILVLFILGVYMAGMLYRANYVDMKVGGWQKNCDLMLSKVVDSDTQTNMQKLLVDLEGYGEDKIAYAGRNINTRCFELMSNKEKFISRYIWFGTDIDSNSDRGVTKILEVLLVLLIIVLVMSGLVIGFNRLCEVEDDDDGEDRYY